MAQVPGACKCSVDGCECPNRDREGWVDKLTGRCRDCEFKHDQRWGPPSPSKGLGL